MTRLTQTAATARPAPHRPAGTARTAAPAGTTRAAGTTRPAPSPRTAARRPVRRLTVLYDPACRLCAFVRDWLARQRQLVVLDLVPVGSAEARRRFPGLDHTATEREITVIGDSGQLYRGDAAWVVCLWALADHRALSHTLATPAGRKLARAAVLAAAKYRESRRAEPNWLPGRSATDAPFPQIAPGWTYDKATGWTQADPDPDAGSRTGPRPPDGKRLMEPGGGPPAAAPGAGWAYDGSGGWTRTRAGEGECAGGCAADG